MEQGDIRIFAGTANPGLAEAIAAQAGLTLGAIAIRRFRDGELQIEIGESVRAADVFVVQPTSNPVNENVMELLMIVDALRRASAKRITAVIPYYGYARADCKTEGREPITAKLTANLLTKCGVDRVLCVDLHAGQIQGFFDLPVDHLSAVPIIGSHIRRLGIEDAVVISPDLGGVSRARELARCIGQATMAILEKDRPQPDKAVIKAIIGDVKGKTAIIVDDIIDTAGTIKGAAEFLLQTGQAKVVYVCATHAVLSGDAVGSISTAPVAKVILTDTIALPAEKHDPKISIVSVAPLLADVIMRIHYDRSVSELFGKSD